ncbi:MAG: helix-turn-helix domain-containing protein [Eubacteriales bacterium]
MPCAAVSHQYRARRYPPHTHGEYQMIYVVSGRLHLISGAGTREVRSPAVMLLGNFTTHAVECVTEEYERYTVTISPRAAAGTIDDALLAAFSPHGADFCPVILLAEESAREMDALFSALEAEASSDSFPGAADALVRLILIRLYRLSPDSFAAPVSGGSAGKLAENVRRALEADLAEKLPLAALGERFHVSVYYLERLFRAQTGYSIGQYRLLCRIAAAREQLAMTSRPVAEIAASVGIADVSNFSRYFRRETGCSPLEYRQKYGTQRP